MIETLKKLQRCSDVRVLVLGDVMLDRYTWGEAERVSPEAPALVLRGEEHDARLGGAGFVAAVLRELDVRTTLAGVVGDDANGRTVERLLAEAGADISLLSHDEHRPTTTKERFFGRAGRREAQQILRVDHELRGDLPWELQLRVIEQVHVAIPEHDVILISDYGKGVCTAWVLEEAITSAKSHGVPVLIDPARGVDYGRYRGASLLAPNRVEAAGATNLPVDTPEAAYEAGRTLCRLCDLQAAVVKLDRDGMALTRWDGPCKLFPARTPIARDVTGAGDVVLAMLGLCQAARFDLDIAVNVANLGAGIEVTKLGAATLTWREIYDAANGNDVSGGRKIVRQNELAPLAASYREQAKRIVLANGCFDLLHVGHIAHLREASQLGDVLIVAINSDESVRRLKGPERPVISEEDRATTLAALACVNHVVVFDDDTPHQVLSTLRPDVLAKGATTRNVVGREVVESYGGCVVVTRTAKDMSTTQLVSHIHGCRARNAPQPVPP